MPPRVLRFTASERAFHWTFAAGYLLLLATGLPLAFPALREVIRGYTPVIGVRLHLVGAVAWVLAAAVVALAGDRARLAATGRELAALGRQDWRWLARFPRWLVARAAGRAALDREVARFNAGQKVNALFVALTSGLLLLSGLMLWPLASGLVADALTGPGSTGRWLLVHRWLTFLALVPLGAHVYLAAVHPPTRGALPGMLDGRVEADWAATHHPRWKAE
jgi:formate dehydrogenase subunit gamma